MPIIPLVTLAAVQSELAPVLLASMNVSALPSLILAASRAVQKFTGRDFARYVYDDLYDGNGFNSLFLRQYPVNRVLRLACNPTIVLTITNTNTSANQRATVELASMGHDDTGLSPVGLTLDVVASGVPTSYGLFFNEPPVDLFTVVGSGTGGTLAAGAYLGAFSVVGSLGESVPCPVQSAAVTAGQALVFNLPQLPTNGISFSLYVSTTNGGTGTLTRQATGLSGGPFTLTSLAAGAAPASAANLTVAAICTAVNALGNGWNAIASQGYQLTASSDLRAVQGAQAALVGQSVGATFVAHTPDVAGWSCNNRTGELRLQSLGTYDPVFDLTGSGTIGVVSSFSEGFQNIRVVFDAGYSTIPADVVYAVMITISDWLYRLSKVRLFKSEREDGYEYEWFDKVTSWGLPDEAKGILRSGGWCAYRRN